MIDLTLRRAVALLIVVSREQSVTLWTDFVVSFFTLIILLGEARVPKVSALVGVERLIADRGRELKLTLAANTLLAVQRSNPQVHRSQFLS